MISQMEKKMKKMKFKKYCWPNCIAYALKDYSKRFLKNKFKINNDSYYSSLATEFERLKYLNIPQKDRDELNLEIKKIPKFKMINRTFYNKNKRIELPYRIPNFNKLKFPIHNLRIEKKIRKLSQSANLIYKLSNSNHKFVINNKFNYLVNFYSKGKNFKSYSSKLKFFLQKSIYLIFGAKFYNWLLKTKNVLFNSYKVKENKTLFPQIIGKKKNCLPTIVKYYRKTPK